MKTKIIILSTVASVAILIAGFKITYTNSNDISLASNKNVTVAKPTVAVGKTKILAGHKWKVQEIIANLNCENVHYVRDKVNSTGYNQDILRLTFNEDGTGTYIDCRGKFFKTNWEFTSEEESDLKLSIPGLLVHQWNLVVITEEFFVETAKLEGLGVLTAKWVPDTECKELISKN